MEKQTVTFFKPYPFKENEKIHIESGPRKGDWEVVDISERKMKLKCPISHKIFEWHPFCYLADVREGVEWPVKD